MNSSSVIDLAPLAGAGSNASAPPRRPRGLLHLLRPYLAPHKLLLCGIALGLLIEAGFMTALSMSLKLLIDLAIVPQDMELLHWLLGGLLGATLLASLVMLWRDWLYARLGTLVVHGVRHHLFAHLQSLSLGYFERAPAGTLMARFTTDLAAVEQVVVLSLPNLASSTLNCVFLLGAMLYLDAQLAALACLLLPFCWLGPRLLLPVAARAGGVAREHEAQVLGAVQENLAAQASVKAFAGEADAIARFDQRLQRYSRSSLRFNFLSFSAERLPNIAMVGTHCVILVVGTLMLMAQTLSIGTLVAFHALLLSLSAVIANLSANFPALLHASTGMQRIDAVLSERPAVAEAANPVDLAPLRESIRFERVCLERGGRRILDELSFSIRRGAKVALVGPSGSGKSTILSLLARMHDPDAGRILHDGVDIRLARLASLRRCISSVLQHNTLLEMSVRENIRLARPQATDGEVEAAARAALAEPFIRELPAGYDSALGGAGVHLSGGQRQRLAIAQALLRQSPVLLLDEATSALDPATERALSHSFTGRDDRRTVLMVTHNLEQAACCEQILVLDQGRLVEQGSHAELLAAEGLYARMWRKQQGVHVSDDLTEAELTPGWLGELPLFRDADPALLGLLAADFSLQRVSDGHDILCEGDTGDRFYVIGHGSVVVWRGEQPETGEIARLHQGDAFGEAALLADLPRNASVRCLGDAVLLTLDRARFRHWLKRDPHWAQSIARLAAARWPAPVDLARRSGRLRAEG